jgi:LmbE family N-acetylglucosaminyl deacetylase
MGTSPESARGSATAKGQIGMLRIEFANGSRSSYRVLCLGAHSDDIEIGCGGTILRLTELYPNIEFYWIVLSSDERRAREASAGARAFIGHVKKRNVVVKKFREGFFPFVAVEVKEYFEELKHQFNPDVIFTHYRHDLHQDHRLVSELTWNTFRNHFILEYEIPKYDGDLGSPNLFVHLSSRLVQRKIRSIMKSFRSQADKQWFDEETFRGILRLRGMECCAPEKFAEAFYCRKIMF